MICASACQYGRVPKVAIGFLAGVLLCVASTFSATADECEAMAGEVAARVPDIKVGRRSSVVIFLSHPSVKYASIGCLPFRNFVAVVEEKYPNSDYLDFLGSAGAVVLHGNGDGLREGAIRCLKRALSRPDEDMTLDYSGLSFSCSAAKLSSIVTVQKK
jgi:hypothetical protein